MCIPVKLYILSIMQDSRRGVLAGIFKGVLRVLSCVYLLAVKFVDLGYKKGLRRVYKIGVPVVSVGNITLGGTGKTPFTIFLANYFLAKGRKPAILIRGYGKDESKMLKDELAEVPVLAGRDRVKNAFRACNQARDILILDDAFQHRRIHRDLNIALIDSAEILKPNYCLPRGVLREPLSSLKRADIFVLTKIDRITSGQKEAIIRKINNIAPHKPVITMKHTARFFTDVTRSASSMESFQGKYVALVSAIASPDYFSFLMEKGGAIIKERLDYPDHYFFRQKDIRTICEKCKTQDIDAVVITAKDYAKIKELDISSIEEKLFILNITIDIVDGKESLFRRLDSVLTSIL